MITVFDNFNDKDNPKWIDIDTVLSGIKNPKPKIVELIERIRIETDKAKQTELKKKLPCILFSGKFSSRYDTAIMEHSGFCCLDFDHLEDIYAKKQELIKHLFVYSVFTSPTKSGLKVIIKIPPKILMHRKYYYGLIKQFPEIDTTSQNESRICFVSYDPDIYINKDAIEFDSPLDYDPTKRLNSETLNLKDVKTNYNKINIAVKMIRDAPDGDKHRTLLKASRLLGGYIASGFIQEDEAIRILTNEISSKGILSLNGAEKTIKDGIAYGKNEPIVELEREIFRYQATDEKNGVIVADTLWERMKYQFKHGKARGTTTYFKSLDDHFTWKTPETTLIIGKPNSGKTEFILQLMLLKSIHENCKWAVFSPENFPADEFYDGLITTYAGKSVDPKSLRQMNLREYEKAFNFVRDHFFYVYPEEEHTIEVIDANFKYLKDKHDIYGTLIDPFNQLVTDMEGRRDDHFISNFLTNRKRFAITNNLYDLITAHPKVMMMPKQGAMPAPDIYDIAGGAMWSNKIDNLISIHRPNYYIDPKDTAVEIHVKKIKKQRLVGIPGMVSLNFDREKNRFTYSGESPFDTCFKVVQTELDMSFIPSRDIIPIEVPQDDSPF